MPSITLVAATNAVTGAADLATLRSNVNTLQTQVAGALTSIGDLVTGGGSLAGRVGALESSLTALAAKVRVARLGFMRVAGAGTATVVIDIDLSSLYQFQNVTLKVGNSVITTTYLGAYGDRRVTLTGASAAKIIKGATVAVVAGGVIQASATA